jgi:hypothetical protein
MVDNQYLFNTWQFLTFSIVGNLLLLLLLLLLPLLLLLL